MQVDLINDFLKFDGILKFVKIREFKKN